MADLRLFRAVAGTKDVCNNELWVGSAARLIVPTPILATMNCEHVVAKPQAAVTSEHMELRAYGGLPDRRSSHAS